MTLPSIRADLVALEGYHSAQVDAAVRLNTNESPFAPPAAFMETFVRRVAGLSLNRYPDRRATALRAAIASSEGVSAAQVFCANGSNEVLQSLLLAYGGPDRSALVFEPTYALHSHIARVTGTKVIDGERGEGFALSRQTLDETIAESDPDVIFLCSPNNPTGLTESLDIVRAALEASRGLVLVDEAYGQFADHTATELIGSEGSERLVVVRTFSKTWGLAGVRLGYAIADPRIVESCFEVSLPYHLSSLTQAAGETVLGFSDVMARNIETVVAERERVQSVLKGMELDVWDSQANFILFRPRSIDAVSLWRALVDRSVLIRDCSSWRSLDGCLRVTIGTAEENDRFLKALKEIA